MTNMDIEIEFTAHLMEEFLTELARMVKRRIIQDAKKYENQNQNQKMMITKKGTLCAKT